MIILLADFQTVVNSIVLDPAPSIRRGVEGTLEVMRYLMRHELSIRSDFPRHHDLVSRVTPLKNQVVVIVVESCRERERIRLFFINFAGGNSVDLEFHPTILHFVKIRDSMFLFYNSREME